MYLIESTNGRWDQQLGERNLKRDPRHGLDGSWPVDGEGGLYPNKNQTKDSMKFWGGEGAGEDTSKEKVNQYTCHSPKTITKATHRPS